MTFFALVLASLIALQQQAQPEDVKPRQGTYAIMNAKIETVTNGTIEHGTIVIEADRIVAVGEYVEIPPDAEIIDAVGLEVYPGMIDSGTQLGLTEIGSVDETTDASELGDITPQMEALTAVNPNSVLIPVARVGGVTTVISEPSGGMLPGTAALINLVGYTPDQMHAGGVRLLVLDFPTKRQRFRWGGNDRDPEERYREAMAKLDETWDRAELYHRIASEYEANPAGKTEPEYVPEMDAIRPVLTGERQLMVKVDAEQDILAAIDWVKERGLDNVVFSGVSEGWRVADRLAEAGIPVITGPVLATPTRDADRYDRAYANAGLMHDAGVKVAIRSGESENVRNLAFNAGFAATYGMGREEALRAVTQT
ncbi:MAG: amidohydrolase, partial [Rhodothermales bacterium]|nr:amidohydrolase [Rhodothermales bacterium]